MAFINEKIESKKNFYFDWKVFHEYKSEHKPRPRWWTADTQRNAFLWVIRPKMPEKPFVTFGFYWERKAMVIEATPCFLDTPIAEGDKCRVRWLISTVSPLIEEKDKENFKNLIADALEAYGTNHGFNVFSLDISVSFIEKYTI